MGEGLFWAQRTSEFIGTDHVADMMGRLNLAGDDVTQTADGQLVNSLCRHLNSSVRKTHSLISAQHM